MVIVAGEFYNLQDKYDNSCKDIMVRNQIHILYH